MPVLTSVTPPPRFRPHSPVAPGPLPPPMNEKLRSLLQRSEADPGSDPASASPRAFADGERGRNMTPTRGMTPARPWLGRGIVLAPAQV